MEQDAQFIPAVDEGFDESVPEDEFIDLEE